MQDRVRKPAGTKERILEASVDLFGHQGFASTGIKAILAASEAPYGSLYHFFPGGKEELGAAAIRSAGAGYRELVAAYYNDTTDAVTATQQFFNGAADLLQRTEFADACPIAAVALEIANSSEVMRDAAAEAFESWLTVVSNRLEDSGVASTRARELAIETFCAMEGAFILARTTRSTDPLRVTGRATAGSIAASLEQ